MKNLNNHNPSNFWFGFTLGTVSIASLGYLLCTKKGREFLKQIIDYAEQVGENPDELLNILYAFGDSFKETSSTPISESIESKGTLETLMEKVKHITENRKQPKKFFVKSEK